MRVLFTPAPAHLHALAPLAWALRAAGHEVRVAGPPGMADSVARTGLTAVAVGRDRGRAAPGWEVLLDETSPAALTYERLHALFTTCVHEPLALDDPMLDDLADVAQRWRPDLVVWDEVSYAGPVVATAVGAAHARMLSGVDHWARLRSVFLALHEELDGGGADPVAAWLEGKLARFGCAFAEEVVVGQLTLDPTPPWLRPALDLRSTPIRPIPYGGPAILPEWLREPPRRPRVCFVDPAPAELPEAVAELDVEVVVTHPGTGRAGGATAIPLDEVLPDCATVVHRGNRTAMTAAMVHGVPQLVLAPAPGADPHRTAALVRQGAALATTCDDHADVRFRLARLLVEPGFAAQAARLRAQVRAMPSPHQVVPVLERLAIERGRTGSAAAADDGPHRLHV
ncbi:nucleotide disphospho-sugar-binding domain-containing protein [Saccharopolyspora sp. CA-218241]|uniref:nucleotide disphospho-sugar-binding domain-containing protein n=1 Tax=Saccharopolyspora sp. CA-218241 TaxID=3240027 RepID=UPI003D9692DA